MVRTPGRAPRASFLLLTCRVLLGRNEHLTKVYCWGLAVLLFFGVCRCLAVGVGADRVGIVTKLLRRLAPFGLGLNRLGGLLGDTLVLLLAPLCSARRTLLCSGL